MSRELVGKALGFIVLAIASLQFLSFTDNIETNFAIAIGFVLLLFAWTDYLHLIVLTPFAFAAIVGFFLGNLDGLLYAIPTGLVFLLFAALMSANREGLATLVFFASIPVAIINSQHYPIASPIGWALVGLMLGLIENAVIEEMAEGDIFIISLYFMALGPLAFIPLAFQLIPGETLYKRLIDENRYGYPVGPAMFVVSVPLFMIVNDLISSKGLPEWLFYAHFHGVKHPLLALVGAAVGYYILPGMVAELENEGISTGGAIMGAVAGMVGGIVSMALVAELGMYVERLGYKHLATLLAFVALAALFFGGFGSFALFSRLHYEGRSSINRTLWFWWLSLTAVALSVYFLPTAVSVFPRAKPLALGMGLLMTVLFYLELGEMEELAWIDWLWVATLFVSAFFAGLWIGFGMDWLLH